MSVSDAAICKRLFVYGTLAPGESNQHLLADLAGSWQPATVRGQLYPNGIGLTLGYPALVLRESGELVQGKLFSCEQLPDYWDILDEFEGDGYQRVVCPAQLVGAGSVPAFVYVLNENH
jgi:gamma-glutamylcyclotransferase (GGCT)/AIG2-like uncharacterized protein YtfP